MEISEKEDDKACNIYCILWKTYTKKEMWLILNTCEMIVYVPICTSRHRFRPQLYLTNSDVQSNIQRYAFVYV